LRGTSATAARSAAPAEPGQQGEQQVIEAVADHDALDAQQTADGEQLHALSLGRGIGKGARNAPRDVPDRFDLVEFAEAGFGFALPTRVRDSSARYSAGSG
jgi:hypothetical protein